MRDLDRIFITLLQILACQRHHFRWRVPPPPTCLLPLLAIFVVRAPLGFDKLGLEILLEGCGCYLFLCYFPFLFSLLLLLDFQIKPEKRGGEYIRLCWYEAFQVFLARR